MFKVPNEYRITDRGPWTSSERSGNNGAFKIPYRDVQFTVIASDGEGWEHVSVSLGTRCPTWEEMCFVKSLFWGPEDVVVQFHPAESAYVNFHPFCLHLWRPTEGQMPTPPSEMIGPLASETKLKPGQIWRTRSGAKATVLKPKFNGGDPYGFWVKVENQPLNMAVTKEGKYHADGEESENDLVEKVGQLHVLYTDEDENLPLSILDGNGQVVLGLCKNCGAGEIQLMHYPTCEEFRDRGGV